MFSCGRPCLRMSVPLCMGVCTVWSPLGGKMPRPHGEMLVATKPNELLHFDFLSMLEGEDGSKYVFVLKDGMSGYVELVPCIDATSDQAYARLLDWFKRFGVVRLWVSDQGAHFKNQVIARLQSALGAHHHFTLAYTPWANGTVEVVNREVLKSVKALLSERKLQTTYWPRVLPVVQAALNSMPSDRLGGATPLTAFTALPGESQLRSILHPQDPLEASVTWVEAEITNHLQTVRAALDGMHAEMTSASEERRRAARDRHAKKRGVTLPKFSEGEFVLAATATGRSGNKLALVWRGPKRIVGVVNDYTFEVQDQMAPIATSLHHESRLQLYPDANRDLEESLVEQVIHGEGGHLVEALRSIRLSPDTLGQVVRLGRARSLVGTRRQVTGELLTHGSETPARGLSESFDAVRVSQIDTDTQLSQHTMNALFGTPSSSSTGTVVELSMSVVPRAFYLSPTELENAATNLQLLSEASGAESDYQPDSAPVTSTDRVLRWRLQVKVGMNFVPDDENISEYGSFCSGERDDDVEVDNDDDDVSGRYDPDSDAISEDDAVPMDQTFF
ncbi:unnamed protein product [Phytophthora fragariaefolia]|uniref:Unnamed protein product n=1 Tax=Phytophthora fragariaefolia TaxID=1490495 RepID=A0A9W6XM48_9STRA|nr:unnamed protein product [Phytophthora fragariaefolia]